MNNETWHDVSTGVRSFGWAKSLGLLVTVVTAVAGATWTVALKYAAQANPAAVSANTSGLKTARDSIQLIVKESYDINARQDGELTRLTGEHEAIDGLEASFESLRLAVLRSLCRQEGNSAEFCERTFMSR